MSQSLLSLVACCLLVPVRWKAVIRPLANCILIVGVIVSNYLDCWLFGFIYCQPLSVAITRRVAYKLQERKREGGSFKKKKASINLVPGLFFLKAILHSPKQFENQVKISDHSTALILLDLFDSKCCTALTLHSDSIFLFKTLQSELFISLCTR